MCWFFSCTIWISLCFNWFWAPLFSPASGIDPWAGPCWIPVCCCRSCSAIYSIILMDEGALLDCAYSFSLDLSEPVLLCVKSWFDFSSWANLFWVLGCKPSGCLWAMSDILFTICFRRSGLSSSLRDSLLLLEFSWAGCTPGESVIFCLLGIGWWICWTAPNLFSSFC